MVLFVLSKRILFLIYFVSFRENFHTFRQRFIASVVERAFYVSIGTLGVVLFIQIFLHNILEHWDKILAFFEASLGKLVKTAVYVLVRTFRNRRIFRKKQIFSSLSETVWAKCFSFLSQKIQQGCQNYVPTAQTNNFREIKFTEKCTFSLSFWDNDWSVSEFSAKKFPHGWRNCIWCVHCTILRSCPIFSKKYELIRFSVKEKKFGCLSIKFQQNCQICIYMTPRTFWERCCHWILLVHGIICCKYVLFLQKLKYFFFGH